MKTTKQASVLANGAIGAFRSQTGCFPQCPYLAVDSEEAFEVMTERRPICEGTGTNHSFNVIHCVESYHHLVFSFICSARMLY